MCRYLFKSDKFIMLGMLRGKKIHKQHLLNLVSALERYIINYHIITIYLYISGLQDFF